MFPESGIIYWYKWNPKRGESCFFTPFLSRDNDNDIDSNISGILLNPKYDPEYRNLLTSTVTPFKGTTKYKAFRSDTFNPADKVVVLPVLVRPITGLSRMQKLGVALLIFALGGLLGPLASRFRLEAKYLGLMETNEKVEERQIALKKLPPAVPLIINPLTLPDGTAIIPASTDFGVVIPKIGVNAAVVATVDPKNYKEYSEVLKKGIAHASTSVFPGENGTVYLFSHSTNYEWFVKDLSAVFYLLKNLDKGDSVAVFYKGKQYNYIISDKKVTKANDATYLYPLLGKKQLILQTCWPPGSTAERLLIFADQVVEQGLSI